MIDYRIIELEHYINHIEDFTLDIIAEKMNISKKQLSRLLKLWDEEQLITYTPGRGRGNKVQIEMKRDVQSDFINDIQHDIDEMSVKDLQKVLQQPWHHHSFMKLQSIVDQKINETETVESSGLIEWVNDIPSNFHPAHINDYLGAQLSHQIFDTLYRVSATGEIIRNLVSYDNWKEETLHIHLKKQVKFSDGTILTAREVKNSLEYCCSEESPYAALFTEIENIEIVNDFYLILAFNRRPKFFEYTLTQKYSAIYKNVDEEVLIGSGPYQIDGIENDSLTLRYNLFYRGHLPDIEKIKYLNQVTHRTQFDAHKKQNDRVVDVSIGEEFLLFNPHKDLTLKQREFVTQVFMATIDEYIDGDEQPVLNHLSDTPINKLDDAHQITRSLKVIVNRYTQSFYEVLKQRLMTYDIQLLFIEMEALDYLNTNLMSVDVDFIWMYENYHNLQPYKTIDLLKQCKFQEWFGQITEGYKFINDVRYKMNDAPESVGKQYLKRLKQKFLYVPIRKVKRKIYVAAHTKNVDELPYGIVNYIDVILDKKSSKR
ncbi:ABC transporter substrate-binding protein [Macrococcus equi]|uniref:ABC transporter substrate-binding protein n=1 Tax=Macrococcus equi TaxID=3395462 RepID=UPI0039BE529A